MNRPTSQVDWQDQTIPAIKKRLSESGASISERNIASKAFLVGKVLRVEYQEREALKETLNDTNDPTTEKRRQRAEADEKFITQHLEIEGKARVDYYERHKKFCTNRTSVQTRGVRNLFDIYRHALEQHRRLPETFPEPSLPDASRFYNFKPVAGDVNYNDYTPPRRTPSKITFSRTPQTFVAAPYSKANNMFNNAPGYKPKPDMVLDPSPEASSRAASAQMVQHKGNGGNCDCVKCGAKFVDLEHGMEVDGDDESGVDSDFDHDIGFGCGIYGHYGIDSQHAIGTENCIVVKDGADAEHAIAINDNDEEVDPSLLKSRVFGPATNLTATSNTSTTAKEPLSATAAPDDYLGPYDNSVFEKNYKNANSSEEKQLQRVLEWDTNPGKYYLFIDQKYHQVRGHRVAQIFKWLEPFSSYKPKKIYCTPLGYYLVLASQEECESVAGGLVYNCKRKFGHSEPKAEVHHGEASFSLVVPYLEGKLEGR